MCTNSRCFGRLCVGCGLLVRCSGVIVGRCGERSKRNRQHMLEQTISAIPTASLRAKECADRLHGVEIGDDDVPKQCGRNETLSRSTNFGVRKFTTMT